MMNKIILFTGKAQSGKSTAADYTAYYLKNKHPGRCETKEYFFASPLKNFLVNTMGVKYSACYGTNEEKDALTHLKWNHLPFDPSTREHIQKLVKNKDNIFMTGREVMEVFGSYICRKMYPDCWALATKNLIEQEKISHIALITDARFPNEIELLASPQTYVIQLLRNPLNRQTISETALDNYAFPLNVHHYLLDNKNLSIEEKNNLLGNIIEDIIKDAI